MRRAVVSLCFFTSVPLLVTAFASCSSDEFQSSGNTGGKAGDSGLGGSAGAGTGGTTSTCSDNSECDDGKACNGTETCESGKCVAGTDAECTNPDANHCIADCSDSSGGCTIVAKDGDGDGHGDSQCTAATSGADDCDDSNADVNPGVTEACNGIDDDCDGKDDIADGFQPSGTEFELVKAPTGSAYQPAIVWGLDSYGMVWVDTRDAGKARIYFALVNADGSLKTTPIALSDPNFPAASVQPDIAWNGTEFAVAWNGVRFILIDASGATKSPIILPGTPGLEPSIQWTGAAWQLGYSRAELRGRSMSTTGQPGEEKVLGGTATHNAAVVRSAFLGDTLGYVWLNVAGGLGTVYFARTDTSLTTLGQGPLTSETPPAGDSSVSPRIGAVGDRFGIAYHRSVGTDQSMEYIERKLDGSTECGPLVIGAADGMDAAWPQRVGKFGSRNGVLVIDGTGNGAALKLARLDDACTLVDSLNLAAGTLETPERNAVWASGAKGQILVWVHGPTTGTRTLRARVFGPNLCDLPG